MADWYLKHGDKEYGPMDSNKLKQLAAQNKIRPTDYIRRGADGKWTIASHAKGLFSDTVSNDPTAPSPINVQSGDTNVGFSHSVPPVAPTPNPTFTQTPNVHKPVAPPHAAPIILSQKTPSSSSMSIGDGLEYAGNSSASSSPKKGRKGKRKSGAAIDKKTILIAGIAGASVLLLIVFAVLIFVVLPLLNNKPAPPAANPEVAQSEEDAASANGETAAADNASADENAAAVENVVADEKSNANSADVSEQPVAAFTLPKDAVYSETGVATCGDVEIKVVSLKQGIEPITEKDGAETDSPDRSTIITLSVKNINDKKTVTFIPWSVQIASGKKNSVLLCDTENVYGIALKPGEVPTRVKRESRSHTIYSDDPPIKDVLVFKRFVPGAKELFLTLPIPGNPSQYVVFKIKTEDFGGAAGAAKPEETAASEDDVSESPVISESEPGDDFNPEDDDEYSELNGVSEAQQKRDQEEADAELKALGLGD